LLVSQNQEVDNKLIEAFSNLSKSALEKNGEIVFILDGLDRLNNSQTFIDSVLNDVMEILQFGIGVVLVGSIPIAYQKGIEKFSSYLHYFPYLNVAEDAEARRFFLNILTTRDSDNFITSEAKEFLITQSGGVLRDVMSLTQSAIEEAYVDGSDDVKLEHAEQASASLARSKFMGLTDANLETLQKVISQKTFTPRTPEDLELLLTGYILEYGDPEKHFAVHPVLVSLIQVIQEENKNLSVAHG
jgi:Cdc6-like AAA superfamily ATPase